MSYQNQLPVSKVTGQPSALTAMVRRSVGLDRPQLQQAAPQPQPQAQPQPRQKSANQADYAEAIKAAIVEATEPLRQQIDALNNQLGGYPPPTQPVTRSQAEAETMARGYVPVRQRARWGNGPVIAGITAKSAPYMDAQTAAMLEKQRQAYVQQMTAKAFLAESHNMHPGVQADPYPAVRSYPEHLVQDLLR